MAESRAAQIDRLRAEAEAMLNGLRSLAEVDLAAAKAMIASLKEARQFDLMGALAEEVSRRIPEDFKNRRLYAQYLIETKNVTAAIDVLQAMLGRLPAVHPERDEALGLLGRCYKQMFVETPDKSGTLARSMFCAAIAAYCQPYDVNAQNTWHGINLVALLTQARRLGTRHDSGLDPVVIAQKIVDLLLALSQEKRDPWYFLTLAEAYLGLGQWDDVDRAIGDYVKSGPNQAFLCASALRQFKEVWNIEAMSQRGRSIAAVLSARVLELEGHDLRIDPHDLKALQAFKPNGPTLEAILGKDGTQTYRFMQLGMARALAVASIRLKLGDRVGTGFLVRTSDFKLQAATDAECLVLTNWHVVNALGLNPGIRPDDVEIVFEAVDPNKAYLVQGIVWSSSQQNHDAVFLTIKDAAPEIEPMPLADSLPTVQDTARVYVIGYAGGHELSISLQDNALLDHEDPPTGTPQVPGVSRVHYRAPTQPGSSGSPVFGDHGWRVIALHHAGSETPIGRLNGKNGTYLANEGISILSIRRAIADQPAGFP